MQHDFNQWFCSEIGREETFVENYRKEKSSVYKAHVGMG